MIPARRMLNYLLALAHADWYYDHAEGEAYYRGRASVRNAEDHRRDMLNEYPDDADIILKYWEEFRCPKLKK